ncbi:rhomboid family intramembrane serine protease GlpG [Bowmanella pacifica]|uniref:Rhomboid family intramembrane serine protease GlpG n=1 Tax=Bowmanella pacifica TaxID=502051 RepID=A0A917Z3B8_9ALTE|nr:rhomboid family intramembrane serine protease GlpG [Bowmanella pacifica]GGO71826.1 rhomboid family intramembrane serine protease GlpG [Bowmanella pacifica]
MQLIAFSQEAPAQLLANYLNQQGIAVRYNHSDGEHPHCLILLDEDKWEAARLITQDFIRNPRQAKYQQAAWQQGEAVQLQPVARQVSPQLQMLLRSPVTLLVLVACGLVYIGSLMGWFTQLQYWLSFQSPSLLSENHQWWRLLGPAFLHFSALHIVFNLLWWAMLGSQIEDKFGSVNLLLIFVLTALFSNYAQYLHTGPNFGGLSGVVYGVMGFVWWCGWLRPQWGLSLSKPLVGFILFWLVLGYADLLWVSVANTAHTVGLVSGCLLALGYSRIRR